MLSGRTSGPTPPGVFLPGEQPSPDPIRRSRNDQSARWPWRTPRARSRPWELSAHRMWQRAPSSSPIFHLTAPHPSPSTRGEEKEKTNTEIYTWVRKAPILLGKVYREISRPVPQGLSWVLPCPGAPYTKYSRAGKPRGQSSGRADGTFSAEYICAGNISPSSRIKLHLPGNNGAAM